MQQQILLFLIFFRVFKPIEFMEEINSSYIPEIKAIVPPDTPGTTSAAPIAMPLSINKKYPLGDRLKGFEVNIFPIQGQFHRRKPEFHL